VPFCVGKRATAPKKGGQSNHSAAAADLALGTDATDTEVWAEPRRKRDGNERGALQAIRKRLP